MDDTARAIGASGGSTIKIAGKDCRPKPLTLKELGELERRALRAYRRDYVQAVMDVAEYLQEPNRSEVINKRVQEAANIVLKELPPHFICDPSSIECTQPLKDWIKQNFNIAAPDEKGAPEDVHSGYQKAAALAINQGALTETEYTQIVGKPVVRTRVAYPNWWIASTPDGQLAMIHQSFRDYNVTESQVAEALGVDRGKIFELYSEVEEITAPDVGNG